MEENNTPDWDTNADTSFCNAMKEDYENSKFNSYIKGLGAELDANLQPGAAKTAEEKMPNVQIYIKGISKEMNDHGLENLCKSFGKIVQMKSCGVQKFVVRLSNSTAFVTCLNINEAERIITSLNTAHNLNITAAFAKEKEKTSQNFVHNYNNLQMDKPTVMPEYLDMQNRKIKGPFGAPTQIRPLKKTIEITPRNYGKSPKLLTNDPNMDFCGKITNKFSNCNIMNSDNVVNGVFNYRENSNVLNGIQKMADQKPGQYSSEEIFYNYQSSKKHELILPTEKCAYCKLPALLKCVCGENYCSAVCQKNNWATHTNVCRPLPKIVPTKLTVDVAAQSAHVNGFLNPSLKNIIKPSITINAKAPPLAVAPFPISGTNVLITAVISHRCFFIRSLDTNCKQEFLRDSNDLAAYALTAKPLQKNPEIGDIFLAEFDGAYYRALAIHITVSSKITVAFIDFGHTAEKRLENLKELSNELIQRKRFTHKIVLKNVPLIMLTEKYLDYLHELVNEMKPLQLKYTDRYDLTLIDTDRKISLETYLIQLNDIKKPLKNDEFVRLENLKSIEIKGENIDVVILDTSCLYLGYMACCSADHLNDIIEQNERLQVYCENVRNKDEIEYYTPRQSEVCLVKHIENNQWYRGALVESVGDGNPTIMFIDFGNISIVNNKNILPMPNEFAFPLYTHSCMIKDVSKLQPFSNELYKRLIELLPTNSTIKVDKCTLEHDENEDLWPTFTLPEILMTLKAENLIPCKSHKNDEIVMVNDLIKVKIEGENIKVAILDTSCLKLGYMACCDVNNFNEIIKQSKQLQTYCENVWNENTIKCYTPRKSEIFLVKYTEDNQWYRGTLIESVDNDNLSIMFIDFGNISIVNSKNILSMPKEFAFPLYTHFCMIKDVSEFQPFSNQLYKRLAELLPSDSTIKVARSTIDYDANQEPWSTFTLPKIVKTLKSENLIK